MVKPHAGTGAKNDSAHSWFNAMLMLNDLFDFQRIRLPAYLTYITSCLR